jgi:hypothetical protein
MLPVSRLAGPLQRSQYNVVLSSSFQFCRNGSTFAALCLASAVFWGNRGVKSASVCGARKVCRGGHQGFGEIPNPLAGYIAVQLFGYYRIRSSGRLQPK